MEYNTPSTYKNYLPSKKIQIVIIILIAIGALYFFAPWAVNKIKTITTPITPQTNLVISTPTGDPTSRDTDGDGVPDWQEIAIGLDINNPQTKPGVPDLTTFETIKQKVGNDTFDLEAGQVNDTDKVSLTIYDALSKDSVKNNGVSIAGTQSITGQELYNYIAAQKKIIKTFTQADINVVASNLENNTAYAKRMNDFLSENSDIKDGPAKIQAYLGDKTDKASITGLLAALQKKLGILTSVAVPTQAVPMHLDILNATQGIYQLVSAYDPTNSDSVAKVSTISLVQDYLITATKSLGYLKVYLSVALDKNGYAH